MSSRRASTLFPTAAPGSDLESAIAAAHEAASRFASGRSWEFDAQLDKLLLEPRTLAPMQIAGVMAELGVGRPIRTERQSLRTLQAVRQGLLWLAITDDERKAVAADLRAVCKALPKSSTITAQAEARLRDWLAAASAARSV